MTPEALRAALAEHPRSDMAALPGRTNHLQSGVLVPISWEQASDPIVIATVRADHLRAHAGEVCFPGGRPEAEDDSLEATALREAHEELGIVDAEILGSLSSIPLYTSDYRLFPFAACMRSHDLVINPGEVASVLQFSVREILARPSIEALAWDHDGMSGLSPIFRKDEHVMYGATAHVFHELLCVAAAAIGADMPPMQTCELTWADVLPAHFSSSYTHT